MKRRAGIAIGMASILAVASARAQDEPDACGAMIEQAAREQHDGKLVTARNRLASCRAEICSPSQRAECSRRGDEIARALPTVAFIVRDAAGRDVDARVSLDDDDARIPLGRAVPVDPGVHEVRWSAPTGAWGVQKLTVVEGEKLRLVNISTAVADAGATSPAPWIVVAGGATLMVASAVFQLVAINEDSDSKNLSLAATRNDLSAAESRAVMESAQSHHDAAKTDQTIAIGCGILGVGAVATGLTWALLRERPAVAAALRPALGPSVAGLSFGRSF